MSQDTRLKFNTQISEEAAEWFIELRDQDLDVASRRVFDAWVRSSPEHLRAYLEIAAIWDESGALGREDTLNVETLMARVQAEQNVLPMLNLPVSGSERAAGWSHVRAGRRSAWRAVAVAATVLIALVAGLLWYHGEHGRTYASELGERRSISLPDGSTVELNSRSRVRVAYDANERVVELLEGQALFKVAKNPNRPFFVLSGPMRVRAVGTEFDVYRKRTGTVVTVVEGKVAVTTGAMDTAALPRERPGPIVLVAGDQVTMPAHAAPIAKRVNVVSATAWTQRQIVLESARLEEVAEEFNRYSARRLMVEDDAANPLRLSGVFTADPDFLIRYLRTRSDVTVHETAAEVRIIRHE